jgi:hypothetical protein
MNITTSIPIEIYHLAVEKNFKWNECLILGIKAMDNQPFILRDGEIIDQESWKSKAISAERREKALQELLNKVPLDILQTISSTPSEVKTEVLSPKFLGGSS